MVGGGTNGMGPANGRGGGKWNGPCKWYGRQMVGEIQMGFKDVTFLLSRASNFTPHLIKTFVEAKASGLPHVLKM